MLDQHLIVKTSPLAKKENIIRYGHYRLTLLEDRLFRLEHSEQDLFRDAATQAVWYRDLPAVPHKKHMRDGRLVVDTGAIKIVLTEKREDCRVISDGKRLPITNEANLQGTYRTLDCCDGDHQTIFYGQPEHPPVKVNLGTGVCSKSGLALFDDASSLTLADDGEFKPEYGNGTDEYVFVYGHDYRAAIRALYRITGATPLLPRFALGNWWSRYHPYTDREYLQLLNRFEDHRIPLTVATVDMDWHASNNTALTKKYHLDELDKDEYVGGSPGWTGYTWNTDLFPDHKAFLKAVKDRHLQITLNLHPADGIRFWEYCYEPMAKAMGIDPESKKRVKFTIGDPNFINHYFSDMHKPLEKEGVDFWWIDWQQGEKSEVKGLDPLWSLNHYHYLDDAKGHSAPLILSRYGGIGSHRYPVGFSGDTLMTWKTLDFLPYFTANATNVGYTWWSHDIGGHMLGEVNFELYVRHLQFGAFSPINRLHSSDAPSVSKEPWYYMNGSGLVAENYLRLRHAMIPYLYTANYRTHTEGRAIVEPLYYVFDQKQAYSYKNEYFFGSEMLVSPVTTPAKADGFARVDTWIPEGKWTDFFTGDVYEIPAGGKKVTLLRSLDHIPVLVRDGGVIPLSGDEGNDCNNPHKMIVAVFEGTHTYTLYEDGLVTGKNAALRTVFENRYCEDGTTARQTLAIHAEGDPSVIPADRTIRVEFRSVPEGTVALKVNGTPVEITDEMRDCAMLTFAFDPKDTYEVSVSYPVETPLQKQIRRAQKVLLCTESSLNDKIVVYRNLAAAKSLDEFRKIVQECHFHNGIKARLLETM